MQLTSSEEVANTRHLTRALSPIQQMYTANIKVIRKMAATHTFEEACKSLYILTGVESKAPTLKKFCKHHNISYFSSEKKSRGGRIGGVNRWKKATPDNNSKTISGLARH